MSIDSKTPFLPYESATSWRFDWTIPVLFQPRLVFRHIASATNSMVLTPLAILVVTAVVKALSIGYVKQIAAAAGQIPLPPGYEYFTPEQQAQFQQAMTATSGPLFTYILPSIMVALGVLFMWLVVGWLLHLILTLIGGRGESRQTLNVAAWASLPFALRDIVQIIFLLSQQQQMKFAGLSGFVAVDGSNLAIYLAALMSMFDLYFLWNILLLGIGIRARDELAPRKVWGAVLLTVLLVWLARAVPALIAAQLNDLTVIRPFF